MNSPILLSGIVTVSPGDKRETTTDQFQNPFRTAMVIDEIRFTLQSDAIANGLLSIQAEIFLGRDPLTNGPIPVASFGRVLNGQIDGNPKLSYTWKLPKPLYVSPTELLITKIFNAPGFGSVGPTDVRVTYAGRSLAPDFPLPEAIHLPWVAAFTPRLLSTPFIDAEDQSKESDLVNPFNESLLIQRFIGRFFIIHTTQGPVTTFEEGQTLAALPGELTMLRAVDSYGNIMVRDSTPFNHLFTMPTRAWTVNTILPPKGFYLFDALRTYIDYPVPTQPPVELQTTFTISMVGHREVRLNLP